MKKSIKNKYFRFFLLGICIANGSFLFAQTDSVPKKELVKMHYYNQGNNIQYILVETLLKAGKKTEPLKNKTVGVYLDTAAEAFLLSKTVSNEEGKAKIIIPPSLKNVWESSSKHNFIAVTGTGEDEKTYELEIIKARLSMDTASEDGAKRIIIKAEQLTNNEWLPAPEVEMKIGVLRLGGILSGGEDETYTTDSAGIVTVEFNKDSLPGDEKGNIILVAKTEDNEFYGNLSTEKKVTWGAPAITDKDFFSQRTLWSTRLKTPFWLLFMAYSIIIGVWGTLIYLVWQIVKIRKLGKT